VTAEDALGHLTEAHAAEVRTHLLAALLHRPGVLDFVADYVGDDTPEHVAEAATAAGLTLDDIDVALITLAVGPGPRSTGFGRFVEATPARRWHETTVEARIDTLTEALDDPEVRSFLRAYAGEPDPVRMMEAAGAEGVPMTDEWARVLAVVVGWDPR